MAEVAETITATGDGTFIVKFGRVISAYLDLEVDGEAGTVVTLLPRETPDQEEPARPMQVILRAGETSWESPGYDSFSEVEVQIHQAQRPLHIRFLRAVFTSQPVVYRGSFASSRGTHWQLAE